MARTKRNAKSATKAPRIPEAWELAKAGNARVAIMPSRTHGSKSRRTERRMENQRGRYNRWED